MSLNHKSYLFDPDIKRSFSNTVASGSITVENEAVNNCFHHFLDCFGYSDVEALVSIYDGLVLIGQFKVNGSFHLEQSGNLIGSMSTAMSVTLSPLTSLGSVTLITGVPNRRLN